MSIAYQIVRDLSPLSRVFCSPDYDQTLAYLHALLPGRVHRYPAGESHNGWVIPPRWRLLRAEIRRDGQLIYDGTRHPLRVIQLSSPVHTVVSREELRRHLFFDRRSPTAVPYHFRQQYRPWERTWGLCLSQQEYNQLPEGDYEVLIETEERDGYLDVYECHLPGECPETIAFVAHLDHPGMANDDLAGCAVGVDLFRRLAAGRRKLSYRLLLVQEIIGSEFYLHSLPEESRRQIAGAVFLEMLGSRTQLALQQSHAPTPDIEWAIHQVLEERGIDHRHGGFGEEIVNDEYVWEARGVPMCSLSRYPYPEYHTDADNLEIIDAERLEEAVQVLQAAVTALEEPALLRKKFEGVVCLSHPSFNLYVDPGQPALTDRAPEELLRLRNLMNRVPLLSGVTSLRRLASECGVDLEVALSYLRQWQERGLVEIW
jgi:aminopeptidase-like protein